MSTYSASLRKVIAIAFRQLSAITTGKTDHVVCTAGLLERRWIKYNTSEINEQKLQTVFSRIGPKT